MAKELTADERKATDNLRHIWAKKARPLGLTQTKVAKLPTFKMTQSAIAQYLGGFIPLNTDIILAFARVLKCRPEEIDPRLAGRFTITEKREIEVLNNDLVVARVRASESAVAFQLETDLYAPFMRQKDLLVLDPTASLRPGTHVIAWQGEDYMVGELTTTGVQDFSSDIVWGQANCDKILAIESVVKRPQFLAKTA